MKYCGKSTCPEVWHARLRNYFKQHWAVEWMPFTLSVAYKNKDFQEKTTEDLCRPGAISKAVRKILQKAFILPSGHYFIYSAHSLFSSLPMWYEALWLYTVFVSGNGNTSAKKLKMSHFITSPSLLFRFPRSHFATGLMGKDHLYWWDDFHTRSTSIKESSFCHCDIMHFNWLK